jgi:hypothetical protein
MVTIELHEKLWFGKYKGVRVIDIIKNKPSYMKKLENDYNINLSKEIIFYYKYISQSKPTNIPYSFTTRSL